jgi:hypothetical protein
VSTAAPRTRRLPLALKLLYTAFMAVMVPFYWYSYGPTNFLYFCDLALFFTLAALWTEIPLLAGVPACGILVPQTMWVLDFLTGGHITGMTGYMFNPKYPLFTRGLSLFHGWLPFLLVYLVWRLGYDRRSLAAWVVLACVVMVMCYAWLPAPDDASVQTAQASGEPQQAAEAARGGGWKLCGKDPPTNVNYVYGLGETRQTWMSPNQYFALVMVAFPLCLSLPAHLVLRSLFPDPRFGREKAPGAVSPLQPDASPPDPLAIRSGPDSR